MTFLWHYSLEHRKKYTTQDKQEMIGKNVGNKEGKETQNETQKTVKQSKQTSVWVLLPTS